MRSACDPALGKAARHAIAHGNTGNAIAYGHDLASSVGAGDERQRLPRVVEALNHEEVAVIQRRRVHL